MRNPLKRKKPFRVLRPLKYTPLPPHEGFSRAIVLMEGGPDNHWVIFRHDLRAPEPEQITKKAIQTASAKVNRAVTQFMEDHGLEGFEPVDAQNDWTIQRVCSDCTEPYAPEGAYFDCEGQVLD